MKGLKNIIWTNNGKELEENLNNIENKFGFTINLEKTMIQQIWDVSCINLKGRQLKEIDTFLYLGSIVTRNGKILYETNERIKKASQFYHLIRKQWDQWEM